MSKKVLIAFFFTESFGALKTFCTTNKELSFNLSSTAETQFKHSREIRELAEKVRKITRKFTLSLQLCNRTFAVRN